MRDDIAGFRPDGLLCAGRLIPDDELRVGRIAPDSFCKRLEIDLLETKLLREGLKLAVKSTKVAILVDC